MNHHFNGFEDLTPRKQEEDWGSMEWLLEDAIVPGAGMSLAVMTLKPGKTSPPHRHPNCHEMIYVLSGELEEVQDGKPINLKTGDSMFVPAGALHGSRNAGKMDIRLLITYSEGKRVYEPA